MELYSLRHEGITPTSPAEVGVVQRSKRYYMTIAGAIAAVPVVILIIILFSMRGRVFFDLRARARRRSRARARRTLGPVELRLAARQRLRQGRRRHRSHARDGRARRCGRRSTRTTSAARKGDWDAQLKSIMAPQLAGLVDYATTGSEPTLEAAEEGGEGSRGSRRAAHGAAADRARHAGRDRSSSSSRSRCRNPAVQRAAVAVAGAAAQRARRLSRHARQGADVAGSRAAPHRVLVGAQPRRARQGAVLGGARPRSRCGGAPRAARRGLGGDDRRCTVGGERDRGAVRCRIVAAAQGAREGADPQARSRRIRSRRAPR